MENENVENVEIVNNTKKEEQNVEEIMNEYNNIVQKIEKEDEENNFEINKRRLHIERLKEERDKVDSIEEKSVYEEYTKSIENSEKELSDYKSSMVKDYDEKQDNEFKEADARNKAIKELTNKSKELSKEIKKINLQIKSNSLEIENFEYEYDEENRPLNSSVLRQMLDLSYELGDKLKELKEEKSKCEEYISELKQVDKDKLKKLEDVVNGRDEEIKPEEVENGKVESKEEKVEEVKSEEPKEENKEEKTSEKQESKQEDKPVEKVEPKKEEKIEAEEETLEKYKNIMGEKGFAELQKQKKLDANKEKVKESKKEPVKNEDIKTSDVKQQFMDKAKEGQNTIATISISTEGTQEYPNGTLKYTTQHSKNIKTVGLEYNLEERESKIIDALKVAYPERDFDSKNEKEKELCEKLYSKYEYADPNVVSLLRNNKKQLEDYIDVFNNEKNKKDTELPEIQYDIRKLSKNNEISYEEKDEIENTAFRHRKIASVKKTLWQSIKFAFKGLAEKIKSSRDIKALPIATAPIKEDDEFDVKGYSKEYEKVKSKKLEEKHVENAKKQSDDFNKVTENWKVENSDGHIEAEANKAMNEEIFEMVNKETEMKKEDKESNAKVLLKHERDDEKEL